MFCIYCGYKNEAGSKFCEACGKPLVAPAVAPGKPAAPPVTPQPVVASQLSSEVRPVAGRSAASSPVIRPTPASAVQAAPAATPKATRGRWIRRFAAIGGMVVLAGFFMPWVVVAYNATWGSAGMDVMEASGYGIASGSTRASAAIEEVAEPIGGEPDLTAITGTSWLWAIPALGLLGLLALNGRGFGSFAASAAGALGMGAIAAFSFQLLIANSELTRSGLSVRFRQGYWITALGFAWSLIYPQATRPSREPRPKRAARPPAALD